MSSRSLTSLQEGIAEVVALRNYFNVKRHRIVKGEEASARKAHGRACVVLLSSHFDRYFYSINEETIEWLNILGIDVNSLPEKFRLQHSKSAIEDMALMAWEKRKIHLEKFVKVDAPLWTPGGVTGTLSHEQLLTWMKSPKPRDVQRLYQQYGIANIFDSITRTRSSRSALYFDLGEMVEKRNNIAHGDATTEALPADITRYITSTSRFTKSADSLLARNLKKLALTSTLPW